MPEQRTITLYTIQEIKEQFPAVFAKLLKQNAEGQGVIDNMSHYGYEVLKSVQAIVSALGCRLADYSIGAHSPSYVTVDTSELAGMDRDAQIEHFWTVLESKGYKRDGFPRWDNKLFPGVCGFTGHAYDDDLLEHVWDNFKSRHPFTLKSALETMGRRAETILNNEYDYLISEEGFIERLDASVRFTDTGLMID